MKPRISAISIDSVDEWELSDEDLDRAVDATRACRCGGGSCAVCASCTACSACATCFVCRPCG